MTTGLLKIRDGKMLVRGGKLAKTCPVGVSIFGCPGCGDVAGDHPYPNFQVAFAGIANAGTSCVVNAGTSYKIENAPFEGPNGTFLVVWDYADPGTFLGEDDPLFQRNAAGVDAFQSEGSQDTPPTCYWQGGTGWAELAANGSHLWYSSSSTCTGGTAQTIYKGIVIDLTLSDDTWTLNASFARTMYGGRGSEEARHFFSATAPFAGITDPIEFTNDLTDFLYFNGSATITFWPDLVQQFACQTDLFQGDL